MEYNIIQDFLLNRRKFELQQNPIIHYKKELPLAGSLKAHLIITFKDYDITFGKYLYYENFCCFALIDEKTYQCKDVTQLFDYVKAFDQPYQLVEAQNQLKAYQITASQRLSVLTQENNELMNKLAAGQRSLGIFKEGTPEWRNLAVKTNHLQTKLTRNQKEIEYLTKVIREIKNLPS